MTSPSNRPPFPEVVDSTMIASFRSCRQKFFREYMQHWKPKTPSVHLHAGAAFAKGLEVARESFYVRGRSATEAVEDGLFALVTAYGDFDCPEDSAKSCTRMAGALEYYFSVWPLGEDSAKPALLPSGRRAIEFSFAEPTDFPHPETQGPVLYVGRMDQICEYAGSLYGEDDKTTSSLGASWSKQWDMRSQFTGYCWGAAKAGLELRGFIVRGISILKTKYDNAQAITYRPQWVIDRWYEQLLRDLKAMRDCWESGVWDYDLDHACAEYGGCHMTKVCLSTEPEAWLEQDFVRRVWDPVLREERLL